MFKFYQIKKRDQDSIGCNVFTDMKMSTLTTQLYSFVISDVVFLEHPMERVFPLRLGSLHYNTTLFEYVEKFLQNGPLVKIVFKWTLSEDLESVGTALGKYELIIIIIMSNFVKI